jgi:hypothetical protein
MRRLISISTAVALLISLASPLLAEACMKNAGRASCHRVSQAAAHHHHCDGMPGHHHDQEDDMLASDQGNSITSLESTCPMNCCLAAQAGNHAAAVHNIVIAPQLAVATQQQPAAVVFVATGFSSHTDRGPPSVS